LAVRPTHFEFYSADPLATVKFLSTVFGWRAEQWEDEEYWLLETGDGPGINGAVARAGDDGPKTLATCDVEDLDAGRHDVTGEQGLVVDEALLAVHDTGVVDPDLGVTARLAGRRLGDHHRERGRGREVAVACGPGRVSIAVQR